MLTLDNQLRRIGTEDLEGPHRAGNADPHPQVVQRQSTQVAARPCLLGPERPAGKPAAGPRPPAGTTISACAAALPNQEKRIADLRRALRAHPCHGCSEREDHARWSERWWKLRRETDALVRQIQGRTNTIAKTFDRVCDVLSAYGYLEPASDGRQTISPDGQRLRRIYGEKDLLISQSLRLGAFGDLDAVEVAALASVLVYQAKREDRGLRPRMPSVSLETSVDVVIREWSALEDVEEQNKLPLTGEPELGLVWPMYKWARGGTCRRCSAARTSQPGTSSAGSSRSLTCSTRSPRSRDWNPAWPAFAQRPSP